MAENLFQLFQYALFNFEFETEKDVLKNHAITTNWLAKIIKPNNPLN